MRSGGIFSTALDTKNHSSNLAQISLILKKKPDVSDQASRNSPRTQYTLNDFSEYRMDINLAQEKEPGKYMNGDVVVYMNHIKIKDLQTVEAYQPNMMCAEKTGGFNLVN